MLAGLAGHVWAVLLPSKLQMAADTTEVCTADKQTSSVGVHCISETTC